MAEDQTALPVRYHLEIYERSFANDPCLYHEALSPFMAFHVGDSIDPHTILTGTPDLQPGHWWRIKDVVHRLWEIEGSHIGHQIGLCVVPVPRPD